MLSQLKPILWMLGITIAGFLLMLLLLGTRRSERKARLSSHDLGTLAEIRLENEVLDARITNVRVLYVVVQNDEPTDSLGLRTCERVKKNGALAEVVRIVRPVTDKYTRSNKNGIYVLIEECNCSEVRIK